MVDENKKVRAWSFKKRTLIFKKFASIFKSVILKSGIKIFGEKVPRNIDKNPSTLKSFVWSSKIVTTNTNEGFDQEKVHRYLDKGTDRQKLCARS